MLEIKDLHVHYGGIHAVQGVSMRIPQGRIVTLIGANGAGKSSVIRSISGLVKDTKGEVLFTPAARDGSEPRTEQLRKAMRTRSNMRTILRFSQGKWRRE